MIGSTILTKRLVKNFFLIGTFTIALSVEISPIYAATNKASSESNTAAADINSTTALLKSIADLVQQYFPRAKITRTATSLHFEDKVHERMHPYIRRNVLSPDLDGILGDVEIKPATPKDRMVGFAERPETIHSVLLMSPYSSQEKSVLSTRLVFQPITPMDFIENFKTIVSSYDTQDVHSQTEVEQNVTTAVKSSDGARPPALPQNPEVTVTDNTQKVATALPAQQITDTETKLATAVAPNPPPSLSMTKYTYPEGKFTVMFPADPLVKYSDQAGMRMVDYVCTVPDGSYNVSYVILPSPPPNLKTSLLLENMSQTVIDSFKGLHVKQSPTTLQGFPGSQLSMPELLGKPGHSANLKIYIVQNFIYIIGVSGKNSLLTSPNAKEFFDTFQVNIDSRAAQKPLSKVAH